MDESIVFTQWFRLVGGKNGCYGKHTQEIITIRKPLGKLADNDKHSRQPAHGHVGHNRFKSRNAYGSSSATRGRLLSSSSVGTWCPVSSTSSTWLDLTGDFSSSKPYAGSSVTLMCACAMCRGLSDTFIDDMPMSFEKEGYRRGPSMYLIINK